MPVIGWLSTRALGADPHLLSAFRRGLKETGHVEGQNVAIEYRFAGNKMNDCRLWRPIWFIAKALQSD